MNKLVLLIAVGVSVIGLSLGGENALHATEVPPLGASVVTPAPTIGEGLDIVRQLISPVTASSAPQPSLVGTSVAERVRQDDAHLHEAVQRAQALRQAGRRFREIRSGLTRSGSAVARSSSEVCVDVLLNSQMDVVEFGDGTGTTDPWTVLHQNIYFDSREGYYNSAGYSLAMVDEIDGSDMDAIIADWDYDDFGQGFQAPVNLTYLGISYSRLYANANDADDAWSNLWTLDNEGYLDELVDYALIGESPAGWSNRYWEITDGALLAALSGKPLALVFDMASDKAQPAEAVWLDDAQVTLCFVPRAYQVYLPFVVRQQASSSAPACTPHEPDSVTRQGSTFVGVVCKGSFGAVDIKDYYSLDLNGVSKVRLRLFDLPAGSNWDALIYEDISGYPLACQIGVAGDQDKSADCTLSLSKTYLILVSAGTAPSGGANTYRMSAEQR